MKANFKRHLYRGLLVTAGGVGVSLFLASPAAAEDSLLGLDLGASGVAVDALGVSLEVGAPEKSADQSLNVGVLNSDSALQVQAPEVELSVLSPEAVVKANTEVAALEVISNESVLDLKTPVAAVEVGKDLSVEASAPVIDLNVGASPEAVPTPLEPVVELPTPAAPAAPTPAAPTLATANSTDVQALDTSSVESQEVVNETEPSTPAPGKVSAGAPAPNPPLNSATLTAPIELSGAPLSSGEGSPADSSGPLFVLPTPSSNAGSSTSGNAASGTSAAVLRGFTLPHLLFSEVCSLENWVHPHGDPALPQATPD